MIAWRYGTASDSLSPYFTQPATSPSWLKRPGLMPESGSTASQVQLQRAGVHRQKGDLKPPRAILAKLEDQASHSAEYHYQLGMCNLAEGDHVLLDPGTTFAVHQVGADTVIDMGGANQMILVGVSMSSLTGNWISTG